MSHYTSQVGLTSAKFRSEPTISSTDDVDFWRNITLSDVDGVFAIDFETYQAYFAGTGVAV